MKSTVAAFIIAFLISAALTPVVRRIALLAGATDEAGGRRIHTGRIPRLGGVAVALAFFAPLLALPLLDSSLGRQFLEHPRRVVGLAVGAAIVLALGARDDLRGVRPRDKLVIQSAAAVVAWWGGYDIGSIALPYLGRIDLGGFSVVVTIVWFVGVINALNLIDGLDGLAAGIAFFACVTNLVVGTVNESLLVVLLSGALGGALLGFLVYNFNPASIFMGDSGSMFLGFVLAATSMLGSTIKSSTTVSILVPVIALGIPITDTVWAFARRLKHRRSIFSADRGHIHHRLLDIGMSQRGAVTLLYGFSLTLTAAAIAVALGRNIAAGGAIVLMAIMLVAVVRTARAFTLTRLQPLRLSTRQPMVEALRRRLPPLLVALETAPPGRDTLSLVSEFARAAGMEGFSATLPENISNELALEGSQPPVYCDQPPLRRIVFPLKQLDGEAHLSFTFSTPTLDDQTQILLQLVADSFERCVQRALKSFETTAARQIEDTAESDRPQRAASLGSIGHSTV